MEKSNPFLDCCFDFFFIFLLRISRCLFHCYLVFSRSRVARKTQKNVRPMEVRKSKRSPLSGLVQPMEVSKNKRSPLSGLVRPMEVSKSKRSPLSGLVCMTRMSRCDIQSLKWVIVTACDYNLVLPLFFSWLVASDMEFCRGQVSTVEPTMTK